MFDSSRPHRWQPTRLPCLGFSRQEHWSGLPHGLQPTRLLRPWDFPGKCSGVGCHKVTIFLGTSRLVNISICREQSILISWGQKLLFWDPYRRHPMYFFICTLSKNGSIFFLKCNLLSGNKRELPITNENIRCSNSLTENYKLKFQ